ncbi:unnamed protein product [Caenorhabditis auriculariae]|uniref:Uncharacterized protein n=1 Tax=Caenorhabditis auriculariae TaxID=2777116 RepID=A0A8S1H1Z8_9PELO|nr:unnamed protein product [Caenorhabditis auriculariae]
MQVARPFDILAIEAAAPRLRSLLLNTAAIPIPVARPVRMTPSERFYQSDRMIQQVRRLQRAAESLRRPRLWNTGPLRLRQRAPSTRHRPTALDVLRRFSREVHLVLQILTRELRKFRQLHLRMGTWVLRTFVIELELARNAVESIVIDMDAFFWHRNPQFKK